MILRRTVFLKHYLKPQFLTTGSHFSHQMVEAKDHQQNEDPQYPPIVDLSEKGLAKHYRNKWYNYIKDLPTVEQKLFELAVQQKLELKKYFLSSVPPVYNGANFFNYITRTHTINDLPKQYTDMNVDQELDEIRETLCDTLLNYYCGIWSANNHKDTHYYLNQPDVGSNLVNLLVSQCLKKLALRNDYVFNSTIQKRPRLFTFWWHGGFADEDADIDEQNLCFQYEDHPAFVIRGKHPLLPILNMDHSLCSTAEVTDYNYHPDIFKFPVDEDKNLASVPGFWPRDPHEYPYLLVLTTDKFKNLISELKYYSLKKVKTGAAVISSFALLNAVAMHQGFSPFHDITYPLVTQTIVTNGQDWNFYVYQLNTVAFHSDVDNKDRRNLCWSSKTMRLFDTIENGQVKGINDEVFKILLKFMHCVAQERENVVMKPYLGTDTREADDVFYTRYLIRKMYNRSPLKMAHTKEVPAWVKIYKLHPDAPPSPFVKLE